MTRILVVDDELAITKGVTRWLPEHQVTAAETVAAACALVDDQLDLLILDFYLPDGTGRDVIAALEQRHVHVPVLLTSGAIGMEEWAEWGAFLADDFMPKPYTKEMLRFKVERLLARHALERDAERQRAALVTAHAQLLAHEEARDAEADAARELLDRITQRGRFDPARVHVVMQTPQKLGGDVVFGDELPDGRYRWMVGDVTGHTLASALVTIPIAMAFYAATRKHLSLGAMVTTIDELLGTFLPVTMFCAASTCELDRKRGTLAIWNGGAPDVVLRRGTGALERIGAMAPPLGVVRGRPSCPEIFVTDVAPGDRIFAFSDGLLDVRDAEGVLFGLERTCRAISDGPAEGTFERLSAAWSAHGRGALEDDLSIIEVVV